MKNDSSAFKVRLAPQDEFMHVPDQSKNYNESMYFNVFDPSSKVGCWLRIGNRPNEGYAEISVCVYLPDGRVAFTFGRPKINDNSAFCAGGFKVEVVEPFRRLNVSFDGDLLIMSEPNDMSDPSLAFRKNPKSNCSLKLAFEGVSPMWGGETVLADGSSINLDPEKSFARAHYEQHVAATGTLTVGAEEFVISGFGLRDKSWGPRHWQAIKWYRWCPMNFGRDFAMMISIVSDERGVGRPSGMVLKNGSYDNIVEANIESDWDKDGYQTHLRCQIATQSGERYQVDGRVLSLIPLRNRRLDKNGNELTTRITEGMTEYKCGDMIGYGLSEYLDQIVDGKPCGPDWRPPKEV
jgi:hypothetical protein